MMLIVLPVLGSVFSGDGLWRRSGLFRFGVFAHSRLYTYVLPDDESGGSIRQGSARAVCRDQWQGMVPSVLVGKPNNRTFGGGKPIDVSNGKAENTYGCRVQNPA